MAGTFTVTSVSSVISDGTPVWSSVQNVGAEQAQITYGAAPGKTAVVWPGWTVDLSGEGVNVSAATPDGTSTVLVVVDNNQVSTGALQASMLLAKGDTIAALSPGSAVRVPVGPDGQVFTADSASPAGVKWAVPAAAVPMVGATAVLAGTAGQVPAAPAGSQLNTLTGCLLYTSDAADE